jgi:hypothetical protein
MFVCVCVSGWVLEFTADTREHVPHLNLDPLVRVRVRACVHMH